MANYQVLRVAEWTRGREKETYVKKVRLGEARVVDSQPGEDDFLPAGSTIRRGPGFCILFNSVKFVGELVVPDRIPQGVDMVAVEFFHIRKREAGKVGYFGEICGLFG